VLQLIGTTTEFDELQALAEALQALPAKLTEAQAQLALDSLLIGTTTDSNAVWASGALWALVEGLKALAPKLTGRRRNKRSTRCCSGSGRTISMRSGVSEGAPGAGGEANRGAGATDARRGAAADRNDRSLRASGAGRGAQGAGGEADRGAGAPGARRGAAAFGAHKARLNP
jgi:hypothetical protein